MMARPADLRIPNRTYVDEYALVFAPPGVDLSRVEERISQRFGASVEDIEEGIKRDPETEKALTNIGAEFVAPVNMETITSHLPRATVSALWQDSVDRCLEALSRSHGRPKVLCGHLVYYSGKRSEFYSVIDSDRFVLKKRGHITLRPDSVLLLIDDLYDMYARLSELYSIAQLPSYLNKLRDDLQLGADDPRKEQLASATVGWMARNMLHLLAWRHLEVIIAENLALQLQARTNSRVRFLLWATKQLLAVLQRWLQTADSLAVYLSHPISEPRKQRKEQPGWPGFASQVNALPMLFADRNISLVMPTGIDELRFDVDDHRYTGKLQPRWPLVSEIPAELAYSKPGEVADVHYENVLGLKYYDTSRNALVELPPDRVTPNVKEGVNAFVQVVVREIEAQIAARDFVIVHHSKGVVVFRPYYARAPRASFSSGVDAEVRLWEDLSQLGSQNRIAFVHFEEDVFSTLVAMRERGLILGMYVDALCDIMREEAEVSRATVEKMVLNKGKIPETDDVLNRAGIAEADKRKLAQTFSTAWEPAKVKFLRLHLTDGVTRVDRNLLGTWVVGNFASLEAELDSIASFLHTGQPRENQWRERANAFLPDGLIVSPRAA